jgi:hypothetical protein
VSAVTGDKSARSQYEEETAEYSNVIDIKRLAGLN